MTATPNNLTAATPGIDPPPLGARIRKARLRAGLTQEDVATAAGLSKPHLSLVETGRARFSAVKLRAVARVLQLDADEMVIENTLARLPREAKALLHRAMDEAGDAGGNTSPPQNASGAVDVGRIVSDLSRLIEITGELDSIIRSLRTAVQASL